MEVHVAYAIRCRPDSAVRVSTALAGFAQGTFSRDDLRYIFSQYHLYTSSFTRFLAAVMVNCESDLFRARLSENLW
jgi:hypothetical protein